MARANPKAWFPSNFSTRIDRRKVNVHAVDAARRQYDPRPYFDTWAKAHEHLVKQSVRGIAAAKRDLQAAKRAVKAAELRAAKVGAMKPPQPESQP